MFDEVLGEDEGDVLERQPAGHVENRVDAWIVDAVDIDPAFEVVRSGTDVETHAGGMMARSILDFDFGFWI
jgi:hypothetical protein